MHKNCEMFREREKDCFPYWPLFTLAGIGAFFTKSNANEVFLADFLWMFAQWLETAAVVPQLFLATKVQIYKKQFLYAQ